MHSRDVEGDLARTFQQQLDYAYGSTFVDRVPKAVKQQIDAYLDQGLVKDSRVAGEASEGSCPTVFRRDYIKRGYRYVMLAVLLSFMTPFFASPATVSSVAFADKIAIPAALVLIIVYFFYAEYEAKKYKQCTSCQTGNIIGTVGIALAQLALLGLGVFFWMLR